VFFAAPRREAPLFARLSLIAPISCPHRIRVQEKATAVGRIEKFFSEPRVRSWHFKSRSTSEKDGSILAFMILAFMESRDQSAMRQLAATLSAARALISINPDRSPSRSPERVRRVPKVAGLERF
jgi:hypothetical protein